MEQSALPTWSPYEFSYGGLTRTTNTARGTNRYSWSGPLSLTSYNNWANAYQNHLKTTGYQDPALFGFGTGTEWNSSPGVLMSQGKPLDVASVKNAFLQRFPQMNPATAERRANNMIARALMSWNKQSGIKETPTRNASGFIDLNSVGTSGSSMGNMKINRGASRIKPNLSK